MFYETQKKGIESAIPEIAQKYPCGRSKAKRYKGSYSTGAELEVELNATTGKKEVLIDCLAVIEPKMENFKTAWSRGMLKIKDLFFQQFNTFPPSIAHDGHMHEDVASSFQILVLFHYLAVGYEIIVIIFITNKFHLTSLSFLKFRKQVLKTLQDHSLRKIDSAGQEVSLIDKLLGRW
ncbi:LOW QUALITY PROTEIN: hypothetical protein Cgig2_004324 [Carnegiea gigantea]|uniref:Uncharacterized protein n=1 Tax=Carnegiea gigantea TaxID=171969 RepID=A0A9Q1JY78_9CARY|nr:LOW QUALITY PROTEIN: hypothetical protein Cgig2_004324 [Carnegiea gigantea]